MPKYQYYMNGYKICKYCGAKTPAANFNCIYCGRAIYEDSGFLGKLRYGSGGLYILIIAGIVISAFLLWYVI